MHPSPLRPRERQGSAARQTFGLGTLDKAIRYQHRSTRPPACCYDTTSPDHLRPDTLLSYSIRLEQVDYGWTMRASHPCTRLSNTLYQ